MSAGRSSGSRHTVGAEPEDPPHSVLRARRVEPPALLRRLTVGGSAHAVYGCWLAGLAWLRIPRLSDLKGTGLALFSDRLGVSSLQNEEGEFRYRCLGPEIRDVLGAGARTAVGSGLDPSPFGRVDRAAFRECVFGGRVVFSRRQAWLPSVDGVFRVDCLALPLRSRRHRLEHLLFVYEWGGLPKGVCGGGAGRLGAAHLGAARIVEAERLAVSVLDSVSSGGRDGERPR